MLPFDRINEMIIDGIMSHDVGQFHQRFALEDGMTLRDGRHPDVGHRESHAIFRSIGRRK